MYDDEMYETPSYEQAYPGVRRMAARPMAARGCNCGAQVAGSFFANPVAQPNDRLYAQAYGLAGDSPACLAVRTQLVSLGDSAAANMTCAELATHIAGDCTIFVGTTANGGCDPNRAALAPGTCGCPSGGGGGGGGGATDNTMLYVVGGVALVAVIAAIMISSSGPKKTLIAKI